MRRLRSLALAFGTTVITGAAVAGLLGLTWVALGSPTVASGAVWLQVTRVGEAHYSGAPDQPVFIMVVGNDAREGYDGARADALHVIGVNPTTGQATVLDIPRDTSAAIPGEGTNKINAALAFGGLALQAETVSDLVGVPIQYAITANFPDFIAMVDEMGGIQVNVPEAMDDSDSGARFDPGLQYLDGEQALAFARNRKDFASGDIKRTENQGLLIISALATLRMSNPTDPATFRMLTVLARHSRLVGLGLVDLYRLGRLGLSIDPANVRNVVIPVESGSGSNLDPGPGAASLFADFADDAVLQSH